MTTWKCRACKKLMESDKKPDGCENCGAQADDILECLVQDRKISRKDKTQNRRNSRRRK